MRQSKRVQLKLSIVVRKEGKQYSSWCPELDVASCGYTMEEACENLRDAVDLYVSTLTEEGELKEVLDERGITSSKDNGCEPVFLSSWEMVVNVSA